MNAATPSSPPTAVKQKPFLAILLTMMLIEAAGIFEQSMVLGALPFFAEHFQVSIVSVSWIITVFILVGAVSSVIAGRLGDLYGRSRVLLVLLVLSLIGSLIGVIFGTLPAIIVARALQGTSAGIIPLVIGIARESVVPARVPVVVSIITATATISGGFGIFAAGIFIDAGQWRLMFATAAGLAGVAIVCALLVLPHTRPAARAASGIDWVGAVLLAPAVMLTLYGVTSAKSAGLSGLVLTTTGLGLVALAFWVWWELRTPNPLVNLRFLVSRKVSRAMLLIVFACLGTLSMAAVIMPLAAQLPLSLPVGAGMSATLFGVLSLGTTAVGFVLAPLAGRFSARHGGALLSVVAAALTLVGMFLLWSPLSRGTAGMASVMAVLAVSSTFYAAAIYTMLVESVPAEDTSGFIGMAQVVRNVVVAIGTVIGSSIIASSVVPGTSAPTGSAWNLTLLYVSVVTVLGIGVALTARGRKSASPGLAPTPVLAEET